MALDLSVLPAISPATAGLLNRLSAANWLLSSREGGTLPALEIRFSSAPSAEVMHVELEIVAAVGTVLLRVEAGLVDLLSDYVLPGWRDEAADRLPVEWRAVLALEAVAKETGYKELVAVEARSEAGHIQNDGPPLARLCGAVMAEGHRFGLSLDLSNVEKSRMPTLSGVQSRAFSHDFDPGFCCRLYLPCRPVRLMAYDALQTGDALLTATLKGGRLPIWLKVPRIAHLQGELHPDTGAIEIFQNESVQDMTTDIENDFELPAFNAEAVYDRPPMGDPMEDLPVRLDFLLATRRISLSKLRAAAPGAVLDFNVDLTQPVVVLANGAPAARGYLVQIGDQVGVQISDWFGRRHDDAG